MEVEIGSLKMKEKWQRPQLVCLYRGKPEESVLCGCKLSSGYAGPNPHHSSCEKIYGCGCNVCESRTAS
jgi:hypothetical protein